MTTYNPRYIMHLVWSYEINCKPLCGNIVGIGENWCVYSVMRKYSYTYQICPDCLASEDYPMLVLAYAGDPEYLATDEVRAILQEQVEKATYGEEQDK